MRLCWMRMRGTSQTRKCRGQRHYTPNMGQSAGKWADNDQDLLGFNFPLIQAACAFCVMQFFVPFTGLIGTILCIAVFAKYHAYASNKAAYNVLLSMAIICLFIFTVGEFLWIIAYVQMSACISYVLGQIGTGTPTGAYNGAQTIFDCTNLFTTLATIGWILTVIGLAMAITETVFIFDLHNTILRVRSPGAPAQVVIVTQQAPAPQPQVVQQTTTTTMQPQMVYASPVGQPMMVQQGQPMMMQQGQPMMMQQGQPMMMQQGQPMMMSNY